MTKGVVAHYPEPEAPMIKVLEKKKIQIYKKIQNKRYKKCKNILKY